MLTTLNRRSEDVRVVPVAGPSRKSHWQSTKCAPGGSEGYRFSLIFKRGVVGTFHKVSAKYIALYVAEFQFRYNNSFNADIFDTAISGC